MALSGRAMLALLVILGVHSAAATMYTVGGSTGWTYQNSNSVYDDQFKSINLFVGDSLSFPYIAPAHNVYEIPPSDVASCNFNNTITKYTQSNPVINLTTAGAHAFACEVPTHCSHDGMALSVTVQAAAPGAAPIPTPSSPPTPAPVAPPTPAPTTAPVPAPATKAPAPAPATKAPAPAPATKAPASAPSKSAPGSSPSTPEASGPSPPGPPSDAASMTSSWPAMVVAAIVAGFAFLLV